MKIGKLKVTFFLSGGQKMIVKCKNFEITKLSGNKNRTLTMEDADRVWSVDVDEITGVTAKWCLF